MQESPGLKPDKLAEIKPLSRKKPNILLNKSLSKILQQIGSRDTRRQFFIVFVTFFCELALFPLAWIYAIV